MSVRDIFDLPRTTRTYLIENVCSIHNGFRQDILSRFQKFVKNLFKSPIGSVRILASMLRTDVRSVFGKNLAFIAKEAGIDPLTITRKELKEKLFKQKEPPEGDKIFIDVFHELLESLQRVTSYEDLEEVTEMIHIIASS